MGLNIVNFNAFVTLNSISVYQIIGEKMKRNI